MENMPDEDASMAATMLNSVIAGAVNGVGAEESAEDAADEYLRMASGDKEQAVKYALKTAMLSGGLTGFAAGVGGLFYSLVALPADVLAQFHLSIRLSLIIASIYGLPLASELVISMATACAFGTEAVSVLGKGLAEVAVRGGTRRLLRAGLGPTMVRINRFFGYRFMTIAGRTGTVNLIKLVPLLGGVVGAGFNGLALKTTGELAMREFKQLAEKLANEEEEE